MSERKALDYLSRPPASRQRGILQIDRGGERWLFSPSRRRLCDTHVVNAKVNTLRVTEAAIKLAVRDSPDLRFLISILENIPGGNISGMPEHFKSDIHKIIHKITRRCNTTDQKSRGQVSAL